MPRAGPMDQKIGAKIAYRRVEIGLTQVQLAEIVGISYQQLQKNETGKNRLSAARLYELSRALGISDINYFYEDVNEQELKCCMDHGLQRTLFSINKRFLYASPKIQNTISEMVNKLTGDQ